MTKDIQFVILCLQKKLHIINANTKKLDLQIFLSLSSLIEFVKKHKDYRTYEIKNATKCVG
jgi:hypothetical protein